MPSKDRSKRLKSYQETFRRRWFAAFNNVASRAAAIQPAELRVATRILQASLRKGRLAVGISDADLQKAAKVTRSGLYAVRSALVNLDVIRATKNGDHFVYELLNPASGKSFPGETGTDSPVTVEDEWGRITF
jgi:CRP-like cAMP-binding protein